jgi:ribonuclease I
MGKQLSYWTIHGLWPSRIIDAASYPCTCSRESFDWDQVSPLESRLNKYWPSLKDSNYQSFWAHEWGKHGTCSRPYLKTQYDYFNTTLILRKRNNPGVFLKDFLPSFDTGYSFDELNSKFPRTTILSCHNVGTEEQTLESVTLCMTASSQSVQFDCPDQVFSTTRTLCNPEFPIYILPTDATNEVSRVEVK